MAIKRISTNKDSTEVVDIRYKVSERVNPFQVTRVLSATSGTVRTVWEFGSSTFLDALGNPLYDRGGEIFQGKQQ